MIEVLSKASDALLLSMREKASAGKLQFPLTAAMLKSEGLGRLSPCLAGLNQLSSEGLVFLIDAVLAERRKAAGLSLVWTGPESTVSTARDTWAVFRELLEKAEQHVLIAGYRFDSGLELLAPLHDRMLSHQVRAQIFLDVERIEDDTPTEGHLRRFLHGFMRENWRTGVPSPEIYYDPRTVERWSVASMHAKCVVVDERFCLIGSANFTDRGHSRNFELGVLIEDEAFAREVTAHWQRLIESGIVQAGTL